MVNKRGPLLSSVQVAWLIESIHSWPTKLRVPTSTCPNCLEKSGLICQSCGEIFDCSDEVRDSMREKVRAAEKSEDEQRAESIRLAGVVTNLKSDLKRAEQDIEDLKKPPAPPITPPNPPKQPWWRWWLT